MHDGLFMVRPSSRTVGYYALSMASRNADFHYEIRTLVSTAWPQNYRTDKSPPCMVVLVIALKECGLLSCMVMEEMI